MNKHDRKAMVKAKVAVSQGNKKYSIEKVLKRIYHKMPARLRRFLSPVRLISKYVSILRVDLWIIKGEEISSKQGLVIMYAGHEVGKNYLIKLAFDNSYKEIMGLIIKPLSRADGVKGFFINNPFIYEDKTGLNGAIFVPGNRSLSKEDFAKIYKDYYIKGLSKLVVYRFGEVDSKTPVAVPEEFSDRITMCTVESMFQVIP